MTNDYNLITFVEKNVLDYEVGTPIVDPENTAYQIRVDWELYEKYSKQLKKTGKKGMVGFCSQLFGKSGHKKVQESQQPPEDQRQYCSPFQSLLSHFTSDPKSSQIEALIIGEWGGSCDGNSSNEVVKELTKANSQLPCLKALFIGDITSEECEISWIEQSNMVPLLKVYPNIEHLQIRGTRHLSLGNIDLNNIKTLIIESGGMPKKLLDQICNANMPKLEHLELWLGEDNYGWTGSVEQLPQLLDGSVFPNLNYLGLRNSEVQDDIAEIISKITLSPALKILDLSLGNMSDKGAAALLASSSQLNNLELLDLHHHFISDKMQNKLKTLTCNINLSEHKDEDEYDGETYRYIAVSE